MEEFVLRTSGPNHGEVNSHTIGWRPTPTQQTQGGGQRNVNSRACTGWQPMPRYKVAGSLTSNRRRRPTHHESTCMRATQMPNACMRRATGGGSRRITNQHACVPPNSRPLVCDELLMHRGKL